MAMNGKMGRGFNGFTRIMMTMATAMTAMVSIQVNAQAVVPAARAALPESIRKSGVLKVAGAMVWPPFNWMQNGHVVGMEVDLSRLMAAKMGLRAEIADIKFATLILSVRNGRYDIAIGQLGISAKRQKAVDFVPNYLSRFSMLVKNGRTGVDINNLCGRHMAATVGSAQIPVLQKLSAQCVAAGKPALATDLYGDPLNTYLALANGRGDGYLVAQAPGIYIAKRFPRLAVAPGLLRDMSTLSGFVVAKNKPDLRRALSIALSSAIADGSYMAILRKYGVEIGAVPPAVVAELKRTSSMPR